MADQDAFKKALAEARAKAAKFREEGKLPPEDPNAKNIKHFVAPKGSQQIIAAGGQEYRDLGLGRRPARLALEDRDHGSSWSGRGGGGGGGSGGYVGASGAGPDYRDAAGSAQSREGGDDRDNSSRYNRDSYNGSFVGSGGNGPGGYSGGRNQYDNDGGGRFGGGGGFHRDREDPDADYKIFVGGLDRTTTTERLQEYFSAYGPIKYCQVKVDPDSGESRGFGFIVFESTHSVDNVIKNLPHSIDGKRVDAKRQHLKTKNGDDKLFCGGVPSDFSDGMLADFFTTYGMVDAVERPRDMNTGMPKGFAFITFKDPGIVAKIVTQRWLTLPNGARIECKAAVPQDKSKNNAGTQQSSYVSGYSDGYDPTAGVGYTGEDWQKTDWSKMAENDMFVAGGNSQSAMGQNPAFNMMTGMEGMSQKQMNKQMKKMMKQFNTMMEQMAGGDQNQMMQMMMMMGGMDPSTMDPSGATASGNPPPPPEESSTGSAKRSRFTPY
ncbi:Oidioi.mRNA.OKI2018_I69.XSR.g16665.t1.cds [Oikopleura dioica]|uniref:Oidioi.mRNA.OKI2018_I69.XSR.g16665.t1.cds n=1 Tax=Oikopleura dioica TaxID=34765 RepID=A0ABN7SGX2_OIKDI|nr:Oidioi.mRNA.OKI2018_I69.XSR.g16665.t1.cds [Oikopleura dioica]